MRICDFDTSKQKIYHARLMSNYLIDTLKFVHEAGLLQGSLTLPGLERLKSYLANSKGILAYSVHGVSDEQNRPLLKIMISGSINLRCQRCLDKLEYQLDLETNLFLARSETELFHYDEDIFIDAIPATRELDLLTLLEDEIILGLPVAPRHQNDGTCQLSKDYVATHDDALNEHPFMMLSILKRTH